MVDLWLEYKNPYWNGGGTSPLGDSDRFPQEFGKGDRLGFPQELGAIASLNNLVGAIARINNRVPHPVNPKILDILIAKRGVSHFRQLMLR